MANSIYSRDSIRKRRTIFIWGIVFSLWLAACGGAPQPKTYTLGVINPSLHQEETVEGFKEGMTKLGYIEGKNIIYLYEGPTDMDKLDSVAQGLVAADVDLILSITTSAAQAAQKATAGTDIPVVFIPVTDPVGAGLVDSLRQPGGNITGVTFGVQEGRRLEWLIQVAPTIEHIYVPYNPEARGTVLALETVSNAATMLGVELILCEVSTAEEVAAAFENIPEDADAIFFLPDSLLNERIGDWLEIAIELKLPTSGPNPMAVADGHLTAYGIDLAASARQEAARLADQILQGIKPADLPVETAEFFTAINLNTAKAIGLDISDEILLQADIIIR
ncbi:MAG TPA: ABC transporter substrate-binding protein [Anaerolineae bacterium]|nr:ABC transporter substrate-binding protein [Anaerolineae bacterium]